jgi:hypothetical protein
METRLLNVGLLAEKKPEVIFDFNNGQGSFLYNHNIVEVLVIKDENGNFSITTDKAKATGTMFQYDSVRCEYPRSGDNIFATLLTAKYPTNTESKLINEYQSAVLGILDENYKLPYENFLKDRKSIRTMIDTDCAALNIPNNI